jgi:hypothetical protein
MIWFKCAVIFLLSTQAILIGAFVYAMLPEPEEGPGCVQRRVSDPEPISPAPEPVRLVTAGSKGAGMRIPTSATIPSRS